MENKNFTKADLKVGYVVVCRGEPYMVMSVASGIMIFVDKIDHHLSLTSFDNYLRDIYPHVGGDYTVTEVYGYSEKSATSCHISTIDRPLLYKREEAKKMTVEEIEKELGYKIEIVS